VSNVNNCIFESKSKMVVNIVTYLYSLQRYVSLGNVWDQCVALIEGREWSYPDEDHDSDRNKFVMNNTWKTHLTYVHMLVILYELNYPFNAWIWNILELRYKQHIHYIMSKNPQSAYTNHVLASSHEYGPTDTTTTLLQSMQKGSCMNVLDNYFIQLFQHNNMIVNEQTLKERSQLYDLWPAAMSCMCLNHPTHFTPWLWSAAIHQSQTFPYETYLHREYMYVTMLTIILLFHLNIQLFTFDTDRLIFTAVLFSFSLQGVQ
jgi:hypothetical protein